jgi:hypothetical protein
MTAAGFYNRDKQNVKQRIIARFLWLSSHESGQDAKMREWAVGTSRETHDNSPSICVDDLVLVCAELGRFPARGNCVAWK